MDTNHPDFCTASVREPARLHDKDCPCHYKPEEWEREFDKQFMPQFLKAECTCGEFHASSLKSFIRDLLRREREKAASFEEKVSYEAGKLAFEEGAKAERERILAALQNHHRSNTHEDDTEEAFHALLDELMRLLSEPTDV